MARCQGTKSRKGKLGVLHAVPGASEAQCNAALQARKLKHHAWDDLLSCQLFEKGASAWVDDIIEAEELREEVRQEEVKAEKARSAQAKAARDALAALFGAAAASSTGPAAPQRGPRHITCNTSNIDIQWALSLMLPGFGLVYEPETKSWRARGKMMERGRSRAAGPTTGNSEWEALKSATYRMAQRESAQALPICVLTDHLTLPSISDEKKTRPA